MEVLAEEDSSFKIYEFHLYVIIEPLTLSKLWVQNIISIKILIIFYTYIHTLYRQCWVQ